MVDNVCSGSMSSGSPGYIYIYIYDCVNNQIPFMLDNVDALLPTYNVGMVTQTYIASLLMCYPAC